MLKKIFDSPIQQTENNLSMPGINYFISVSNSPQVTS